MKYTTRGESRVTNIAQGEAECYILAQGEAECYILAQGEAECYICHKILIKRCIFYANEAALL